MNRSILLTSLILLLLGLNTPLWSQGTVYGGFKAGINFSNFDGPSIMDANGNELENFKYSTGFHFGTSVNFNVTDYFGLRAEIIYGQKGTEYDFNGASFLPFYLENQDGFLVATGNRNAIFTVTNTYLEFPVSAFVRFRRLELSGGLSFGILLSSRAAGEIAFSNGNFANRNTLDNTVIIVDGSYFDVEPFDPANAGQSEIFRVDNNNRVVIPELIGTYYENENASKSLYRRLDASVQGGASFYLNEGLYVSFKAYYGLTDITRNEEDFSITEINADNTLVFRDDQDRNITLQASVGFHF